MTLLVVEGLSKRFGAMVAVDRVGFTLAAGEMLALIGPNGAGKTTCFNLLNGQLRPDAGRVTLEGVSLVGLTPRRIWRLGVGRTFQVPAAFASMTACENLQVVLLSHHRRAFRVWRSTRSWYAADALALLERVGVAHVADQRCGTLAYGDLKRVELALALAGRPRLLLMDEPTAGMAPADRQALIALTRALVRERGLAAVFIEHDMDVVFGHADRIIVLDHGRILADGSPAAVRDDAQVRAVYLGTSPGGRGQ
ncbi:MAG: ATP-binding cassette domain-containing protein [Azospirillum sp.]|nr:ATP-binding cassette domain-containing protein [Azospirillum sp.]